MSMWTAMVVIVAIIAFWGLRSEQLRTGARRRDGDAASGQRESELEREIVELRKRLEVVERIATDAEHPDLRHSKAVASEIESLRDR